MILLCLTRKNNFLITCALFFFFECDTEFITEQNGQSYKLFCFNASPPFLPRLVPYLY